MGVGEIIGKSFKEYFNNFWTLSSLMAIFYGLPYLILMLNPKLVHLLPKPGKWMVRLKQLMGALLMLTALWLV